MNTWRPASRIRLKSLGLHWRGDRLLAAEVWDDAGRVIGVRPLGGTVEFGETVEAALIREFREELGIEVRTVGAPFFMENIYMHEGSVGHEILAVFEVAFPDGAYADQARIDFKEDNNTICSAEWFTLSTLDSTGGLRLFPDGLKAHLLKTKRAVVASA
jgi:ADP-ribose pyrophosphatase YjhB (NUDIX family)